MEVVFQPSWVGLEEPVLVDVDLLRRPGPDLLSQLDVGCGPVLRERGFETFYLALGPLCTGC